MPVTVRSDIKQLQSFCEQTAIINSDIIVDGRQYLSIPFNLCCSIACRIRHRDLGFKRHFHVIWDKKLMFNIRVDY